MNLMTLLDLCQRQVWLRDLKVWKSRSTLFSESDRKRPKHNSWFPKRTIPKASKMHEKQTEQSYFGRFIGASNHPTSRSPLQRRIRCEAAPCLAIHLSTLFKKTANQHQWTINRCPKKHCMFTFCVFFPGLLKQQTNFHSSVWGPSINLRCVFSWCTWVQICITSQA